MNKNDSCTTDAFKRETGINSGTNKRSRTQKARKERQKGTSNGVTKEEHDRGRKQGRMEGHEKQIGSDTRSKDGNYMSEEKGRTWERKEERAEERKDNPKGKRAQIRE